MTKTSEIARRAEKHLLRQGNSTAHRPKPNINEIEETEYENVVENNDNDPNVDAFSHERKVDTSKYQCWNCDAIGHSFFECPIEQRNLLCYKCGAKNVTTVTCKRHLVGNRLLGEKVAGNTRSFPTFPSQR